MRNRLTEVGKPPRWLPFEPAENAHIKPASTATHSDAQNYYRIALSNYTYDFNQGDAKGLSLFDEVNVLDKAVIYRLLSEACFESGDMTCAIKSINDAINLKPANAEYTIRLAIFLVLTKKYKEAQDALRQTNINRDKRDPLWDLRIANVAARMELDQANWSYSIDILLPLVQNYRSYDADSLSHLAESLYLLAKSSEKLNNIEEACYYYQTYIDLTTRAPAHVIQMGETERSNNVLNAIGSLDCPK